MEKLTQNIPHNPGVYKFLDEDGKIIYIGKAIDLKRRINSYFQKNIFLDRKTKLLVDKIKKIEWIVVQSEFEALLLEASLIKKYQPFFNIKARDDKRPLFIKITNEEFPKVFISRFMDDTSIYFGPFPSVKIVRKILFTLRKIFPFCSQKKISKKPCFWSHINLCKPCPSYITKQSDFEKERLKKIYVKNIKNLIEVLSGNQSKVVKNLTRNMRILSKKQEYEKAQEVRNQIKLLDYLWSSHFSITNYLENPNFLEDVRTMEQKELFNLLKGNLGFKKIPRRIECFDASHISGTARTVAMVTFVNGEPEKSLYRRFKIKTKGSDDLKLLEEALTRRFRHKEWGYPDLLVIDGSKNQINLALKVVKNSGTDIPIIGLAKPFDKIVTAQEGNFRFISLANNSGALHLLQRLRDEAHRFARSYHHHLRKYLLLGTK